MGRGRKASIERERVRPRNNEEKKGGEGDKEGGREGEKEGERDRKEWREREGEKGIKGGKNKTDGDSGNRKILQIHVQF